MLKAAVPLETAGQCVSGVHRRRTWERIWYAQGEYPHGVAWTIVGRSTTVLPEGYYYAVMSSWRPEQGTSSDGKLEVLDLFCGMGGLALGFARNGYTVTGCDINPWVPKIFSLNRIGEAFVADLSEPRHVLQRDWQAVVLVTGGPPCRPWSALNVRRRGHRHPDYGLLGAYFRVVRHIMPQAFLMENVPLLESDPALQRCAGELRGFYDTAQRVIRYADFGAATARHRLVVVGFRKGGGAVNKAEEFFKMLDSMRCAAKTVGEVLAPFRGIPQGMYPDHVWPNLRTIERYREKYSTNQYGWYRLDPDRPAPSFGNVMKTYTLHPYSGNGAPARVISVREAMALMGFGSEFRFPEGMAMRMRYQMVADAVSPVFSAVCARVMRELLT